MTEFDRVPVLTKVLPSNTRIRAVRVIRIRRAGCDNVIPLHQRVLAVAVSEDVQSTSTADEFAVAPVDANHVVRRSELEAVTSAVVVLRCGAVRVTETVGTAVRGNRGDAEDGTAFFEGCSVLGGGGEGESAGAQGEENGGGEEPHGWERIKISKRKMCTGELKGKNSKADESLETAVSQLSYTRRT